MKHLFIYILTMTILSCKDKHQVTTTKTLEVNDTIKAADSGSKIKLDFEKNKDLLDIILLLPDSAFSSWHWTFEDRTKWYNEIKENNFYTDEEPMYFNQKYFEPYKAGFTIVDGSWSINLYKAEDNSYIVITDDIVGDGHTLNFFEVKVNSIKSNLVEKSAILNFVDLLKKTENIENCQETFVELNGPFFNYDYTNTNQIEIESSWYFIKEEYENCLIGNALRYNFNPKTKHFELEKIYWKPKQNN